MFQKRLFPGGIHPHKGVNGKAVTGVKPIVDAPAPARVVIPMGQHIGAPAKPVVKKGDLVKVGQLIGEANGFVSANVHASVSGKVAAVQNCVLANGMESVAVVIDNDFQDEWVELTPAEKPEHLNGEQLVEIVRNAGIVGMGGAGFPTAVKLKVDTAKSAPDYLIINGSECEPYLTADHRLMVENPDKIIDGIRIVMLALNIKEAIIGVENNKPDAIEALRAAATENIKVMALPVRYPEGGEKQLVYATTRRKVPTGGLPLAVGCVVVNVGTIFAIDEAVRLGKPLVSRITSVGGLVNEPGNYRVRIGATVEQLLDACGGLQDGAVKLLSGGPMMGAAISRTDIPVTKATSGIIALGKEAVEPEESPCIRCGRCMRACPMNLAPAKIDAAMRMDNYEAAEKVGAMNCIECGCCTFVCPAKRSLTQSCRTAKKVINTRRKQAAAKKEG
ncbi:MAG: electron transport complex subunit RsxC [Clostridia bacterium]|nr:electron transport complex subunit RsxC [Clostridia bacterium]